MRIVVFSVLPVPRETPWWSIVLGAPSLEAVLLCRQQETSRGLSAPVRRLIRALRRDGPLYIPWRIARMVSPPTTYLRAWAPVPASSVPVEEIVNSDIHDVETRERVASFGADLGISIGAPLLRPSLFAIPRLGTLNVHLGKVPDYRGATPAFWELQDRAPFVGATIHLVDERLDTGPIVRSGIAEIDVSDSRGTVEARVSELGAALLRAALEDVTTGHLAAVAQGSGGRTNRSPTVRQLLALDARLLARRLRRTGLRGAISRIRSMLFLFPLAPARDTVRSLRKRHAVTFIVFERITWLVRGATTPEAFLRILAYLQHHFRVVSVEDARALNRFGAGLREPVAAIVFSGRDRTIYDTARPILEEAGITAGLLSSSAAKPSRGGSSQAEMTVAEVNALVSAGWSILPTDDEEIRYVKHEGESFALWCAKVRGLIQSPRRTSANADTLSAQAL